MNKERFSEKKRLLIEEINKYLSSDDIGESDKNSLNKVLELLSQYTFENRLRIRGLLSHTVVDSFQLDYSVGKCLIEFDHDIT